LHCRIARHRKIPIVVPHTTRRKAVDKSLDQLKQEREEAHDEMERAEVARYRKPGTPRWVSLDAKFDQACNAAITCNEAYLAAELASGGIGR
jgi:hypothetical protein